MMNGMNKARRQSKAERCCNWLQDALWTISFTIVSAMESGFRAYGVSIGKYPFVFIVVCLGLAGLCSIGLLKFGEDTSDRQFMSSDSQFKDVLEWQQRYFREEKHQQRILFEAENVLDKSALLEMLHIRNKILNMTVDDITWESICARRANVNRCNGAVPPQYDTFCHWQQAEGSVCWEESILQIWNYDEQYIKDSTQDQIFSYFSEWNNLTSGFRNMANNNENLNDSVVIKKAVMHAWYTDASKYQWKDSFKWEDKFMEKMDEISKNIENVTVYYAATSSFGKIVAKDINEDLKYLFAGFILVFLYVLIMLGKFNLVEQRPLLSLLGLSCVGLALLVSYGLSSAFDIPYGAMNSILPFLLLGLGIDDMFVIMSAWNNIPTDDQKKPLQDRIGLAMQHAGVSITVTSVTNFLAFLIGSSSALPGLRYFCLYAAIGIASIYFFQTTFFVACLTLDQRRLEDTRQGCLFCWKLENWTPNECSQNDYCKICFLKLYGRFLFTTPAQILVMCLTLVLFFLSIWGVSNIQQEFDPIWFLPSDSNLVKFLNKIDFHFPSSGEDGEVYFANISYNEWPKLGKLVDRMKESEYISEVDSWYENFKQAYDPNITEAEALNSTLKDYLYSCSGSRYLKNFRFIGGINCSHSLPVIIGSKISYQHTKLKTTNEKMDAIRDIVSMVRGLGFEEFSEPYTRMYITWETNHVIGKELVQNVLLALLMVFLVTLLLLASLSSSLMVMVCVLATLVDVAALMHWWGLTIDTISAIDLVLAIGLSVDYAAHIAHTFMTVLGSTKERARLTVGLIGPAVLNGGFTTFLSFALLAGSDSYVFQTFFKIFFGVSLFGVYHGLVFLPVLLSLIGPEPYPTARPSSALAGTEKDNKIIPAIMTVGPSPPVNSFRSPTPDLITSTPSPEPDRNSIISAKESTADTAIEELDTNSTAVPSPEPEQADDTAIEELDTNSIPIPSPEPEQADDTAIEELDTNSTAVPNTRTPSPSNGGLDNPKTPELEEIESFSASVKSPSVAEHP